MHTQPLSVGTIDKSNDIVGVSLTASAHSHHYGKMKIELSHSHGGANITYFISRGVVAQRADLFNIVHPPQHGENIGLNELQGGGEELNWIYRGDTIKIKISDLQGQESRTFFITREIFRTLLQCLQKQRFENFQFELGDVFDGLMDENQTNSGVHQNALMHRDETHDPIVSNLVRLFECDWFGSSLGIRVPIVSSLVQLFEGDWFENTQSRMQIAVILDDANAPMMEPVPDEFVIDEEDTESDARGKSQLKCTKNVEKYFRLLTNITFMITFFEMFANILPFSTNV